MNVAYDALTGEAVPGSEDPDAGMVMLWLLENRFSLVWPDVLEWAQTRNSAGEGLVGALFSTAEADRTKETFLDYVQTIAEVTGAFEGGAFIIGGMTE